MKYKNPASKSPKTSCLHFITHIRKLHQLITADGTQIKKRTKSSSKNYETKIELYENMKKKKNSCMSSKKRYELKSIN